jgi:hypothetical protein
MIHISPLMRVLVATSESTDVKGLTLWCDFARRNWERILFPVVYLCFGAAAGPHPRAGSSGGTGTDNSRFNTKNLSYYAH